MAEKVLQLGQDTLLPKIDIKSAYHIVVVHPNDKPLIGMLLEDMLYVDTALLFSLRSAPKIFNTFRCTGVDCKAFGNRVFVVSPG